MKTYLLKSAKFCKNQWSNAFHYVHVRAFLLLFANQRANGLKTKADKMLATLKAFHLFHSSFNCKGILSDGLCNLRAGKQSLIIILAKYDIQFLLVLTKSLTKGRLKSHNVP